MQSGDRVLVYHSPGSPLEHWIYATVLSPQTTGALVKVDHESNDQHGVVKFYPTAKIRTKDDLPKLAQEARDNAAKQTDSTRRQDLLRFAAMYDFQASVL